MTSLLLFLVFQVWQTWQYEPHELPSWCLDAERKCLIEANAGLQAPVIMVRE